MPEKKPARNDGTVWWKPQFIHDCDQCVFLGQYKHPLKDGTLEPVDLYFCPAALGGPTVIARYGNEGPEYSSGISFGLREGHVLREALIRALKKSPEIRHSILDNLLHYEVSFDDRREATVKIIENLIDEGKK